MIKTESTAKVELSNNPYLRKTEILFKNKPPKNNSHVTQYLRQPLRSWIRKVPSIFHDEMNGYDFRLDFKGTVLDFEELKKAFKAAGVKEGDVRFNHINVLGDRKEKIGLLKAFYQWILDNPNRKLEAVEIDQVKAELEKLLYAQYTLILITGNARVRIPSDDSTIKVESVADADSLQGTLLNNIPIIFYLDSGTVTTFQANLEKVQAREDISDNQLFFWIPALPDRERIIRVIKDLGISDPQIVEAADDDIIKRYCDIYPISQSIYESIKLSQKLSSAIEERLKNDEEQTKISSNDVGVEIREIEGKMDGCKVPYEGFLKRDHYCAPEAFKVIRERLMESVLYWQYGWRIFGTKLIAQNEAEDAASDFEKYLNQHYAEFLEEMADVEASEVARIEGMFAEWYGRSPYSPLSFQLNVKPRPFDSPKTLPPLAADLLQIKEAEDLGDGTYTVWYYHKWREHIVSVLTLVAHNILDERIQALEDFYNHLAEAYLAHLDSLIRNLMAEKKALTAQLSDEMKQYQEDRDWWENLNIKLAFIERG